MPPLYVVGDKVFVANRLTYQGKPMCSVCTFVRMQGCFAVVTHGRRMVTVKVERMFKTYVGAMFLGWMECIQCR